MMMTLAELSTALVRHHIATAATPLPPAQPGITWIWAANGIWKRGVSADLDILIPVGSAPVAPGLAALLPHVRWRGCPRRLPGSLLTGIHLHARRAAAPLGGSIPRPIEQQYHIILNGRRLKVALPEQDATPGRVRYEMPEGQVLVDLHSHHGMAAYFSATDDRDDQGLSVSVVIGRIFDRPEIAVRLNCYGHRTTVPATLIFESLGGFADTARHHATITD